MIYLPIKKGDLVYIDFIGKIKETGEVFDTTIEDEAKKAGIFDENQIYEPMLVAVGKLWVVEGLDEALVGKEEHQEFEVEVSPEKGFGERDAKKVVLYTRRKLIESGIKEELRPGMVVTINGLPAIVRVASGGRYLLDFNPPLAGKTLIYKISIKSICKTLDEKIRAITKRRSRKLAEKKDLYKCDVDNRTIEFYLDEKDVADKDIQSIKTGIVHDIFELLPEFKEIRFIEIYKKAKDRKKEIKKKKVEGQF